jgi:hypothetical protein
VLDLRDRVAAGFAVRSMIISLAFFSDGHRFLNFRVDGGVRQSGEDGITGGKRPVDGVRHRTGRTRITAG